MKLVVLILISVFSAAAVAAGLWAWQQAPEWVLDWGASRPDVAQWAVRSAAVAAVAGAQVVLLNGVVSRIYRRGIFDSVMTFAATAILALGCVSAIACGFAGR